MKKDILVLVALIVIIFVLSSITVNKSAIKDRVSLIMPLKHKIEQSLNVNLSFSLFQNFMHVPFFLLLSFAHPGRFPKGTLIKQNLDIEIQKSHI